MLGASGASQNVLTPTTATAKLEKPSAVSQEKPVDWFARSLAIGGLLLGVGNLAYSIRKTKRDRRLSIEDDFWFRKIITPTTVEPMLKTVVGLLEALPTRGSSQEQQGEYAFKVTREFIRLKSSVQPLALFDDTLPDKVFEQLRHCEDTFTEYSRLIAQEDASQDLSPEHVRQTAWSKVNEALRAIRDRQLKY